MSFYNACATDHSPILKHCNALTRMPILPGQHLAAPSLEACLADHSTGITNAATTVNDPTTSATLLTSSSSKDYKSTELPHPLSTPTRVPRLLPPPQSSSSSSTSSLPPLLLLFLLLLLQTWVTAWNLGVPLPYNQWSRSCCETQNMRPLNGIKRQTTRRFWVGFVISYFWLLSGRSTAVNGSKIYF